MVVILPILMPQDYPVPPPTWFVEVAITVPDFTMSFNLQLNPSADYTQYFAPADIQTFGDSISKALATAIGAFDYSSLAATTTQWDGPMSVVATAYRASEIDTAVT